MARLVSLERPDVLTDVLGTLKLRGRVFCVSELSAPWGMSLAPSAFAHFHVIERGGAWMRMQGAQSRLPLASGDLIILPHGKSHTLSDSPQARPVPLKNLIKGSSAGCNLIRHGGGGAETLMTCGSFQFEAAAENPLLAVLPPLIHVRGSHGRMAEWLEPALRMLAHEARHPRPGSETMITRLTDIIFVQAVRAWVEEQPQNQGGWLGALRDRQIGAALGLMHREPQRDWNVAALAGEVAMSRSPFAAKFSALVGEPPLAYLTKWRMHLAATLLADEQLTVSEAAERVGYESEAAFSKAFKRRTGIPPGAHRRMYATGKVSRIGA